MRARTSKREKRTTSRLMKGMFWLSTPKSAGGITWWRDDETVYGLRPVIAPLPDWNLLIPLMWENFSLIVFFSLCTTFFIHKSNCKWFIKQRNIKVAIYVYLNVICLTVICALWQVSLSKTKKFKKRTAAWQLLLNTPYFYFLTVPSLNSFILWQMTH